MALQELTQAEKKFLAASLDLVDSLVNIGIIRSSLGCKKFTESIRRKLEL